MEALSRSGLVADEQSRTLALISNYGTGGDPKNRGMRMEHEPAPTLTSKADRNKWKECA